MLEGLGNGEKAERNCVKIRSWARVVKGKAAESVPEYRGRRHQSQMSITRNVELKEKLYRVVRSR